MGESDLEKNDKISVTKSHKEILELIEKLKEIEREFGVNEFENEFVEVKEDVVEFLEIEPVLKEEEVELKDFEEPIKKGRKIKVKYKTRHEVKKLKEKREAATFRIRFDNEGDLVNIDLHKVKPKFKNKKEKVKTKKKNKQIEKSNEKEPKSSRFRRGLSVLKRSIPQKEEKTEEEYDEEDEDEDEEEDY
jgi:hypothetical protein